MRVNMAPCLCARKTEQALCAYSSYQTPLEVIGARGAPPTLKGSKIMKVTFLSKWTVLLLTVITAALVVVGVLLSQQGALFGADRNVGLAVLSFLVAAVVYLIAWIVGLIDSIQERRFGWTVALIILSPVLIGPLLYSLIGPRNTK